MAKETKSVDVSNETRTAATVFKDDLKVMKEIAQIKFDKDPMNSAWKEAVKLFIEANEDIYLRRYEELKKSKK
jgi:RNase adaptor protein for sRNA GlmZ degradation